jgi:transcriptional regulator with XRE-family HTH domain
VVCVVDDPADKAGDSSIGRNIAAARKVHRLSQRELAERAHVSYSLLTKVETGVKPATPALVGAMARALGIPTASLQGQPYRAENARERRLQAAVDPLRRMLYSHDLEPDDEQLAPRPLTELQAEVDRALVLRQDYRLVQLGEMIPSLLEDLTAAAHVTTGHDQEEAFRLLALGYRAARSIPYRLGYPDMVLLTDRCFAWAAERSGDPLMAGAVSDWLRVDAFFQTGDYTNGLRLVDGSLRQLAQEERRDDVAGLSVYGSMHLRGAILAARAGRAELARDHIAEATETAERVGEDNNVYQLAFGPANAAVHAAAAEVELGNAPEAIEHAAGLHLPAEMPRERSSHHFIDMSRAWLWQGDRDRSLRAVLTAEELAPHQTRYHPMARETVRVLVRLERHTSDSLIGLASRLGVA